MATLTWSDVVSQTSSETAKLSDFAGHNVTLSNFANETRYRKNRETGEKTAITELFADCVNGTMEPARVIIPATYAKRINDVLDDDPELTLSVSVEVGKRGAMLR